MNNEWSCDVNRLTYLLYVPGACVVDRSAVHGMQADLQHRTTVLHARQLQPHRLHCSLALLGFLHSEVSYRPLDQDDDGPVAVLLSVLVDDDEDRLSPSTAGSRRLTRSMTEQAALV